MSPELTLLYVHGTEIGYARMGSYIASELFKRGVTVWDNDGREDSDLNQKNVVTDGYRAAPSPTNVVCWASVPSHAGGHYDGQYASMLTMWESMRLPEAFRETFDSFDLMMVPSWQNVELFSRYHDNVRFVPLGVDPTVWKYTPAPSVGPTFNFMIAGRGKRKGCDVAYEAFQTVFGHWWDFYDEKPRYVGPPDKPIPQLIMKSLKGHGDYYAPGVRHVTGKLTDREEVELYASAHCYIQPSRGEGFGLQPLQALALGRPTILTGAHGHESYAHLGIGIDSKPTDADYFMMGDAGQWWEPDFEQVCEAMWDVYSHYDIHSIAAHESAIEVAQNWTWANTADKFVAAFDGELAKPYSGSGVWLEHEARMYPVATLRQHTMEAAGRTYQFEPGVELFVPADVMRVLFDAQLLDPEFIAEDGNGLAPVQIEQLGKYRADNAHCRSCGQELNTRLTLGDKYFQMDEHLATISEHERTIERLERELERLREHRIGLGAFALSELTAMDVQGE